MHPSVFFHRHLVCVGMVVFSLNIAVLSIGLLHAQEFRGRIMANDSAGVPYVTIYFPALRMGAITDQQ